MKGNAKKIDIGATSSLDEIIEGLDSIMVRTLDEQLDDIRELASEVEKRLSEFSTGEDEDVELVKELVKKILRLDQYIDSLR